MTSVEYDLAYLREGTSQLEDYLLSKELYWSIGISAPPRETPFPRLTLGGILLAQTRIKARSLKPEQKDEINHLDELINEVRSQWREAWGRKSAHGYRARLNLWRNYLEEYRHDPWDNYSRYHYEVRLRVMLHLLALETDQIPMAQSELLQALDQLLQAKFIPGEFIWEQELSKGFPTDTYWYLYGRLQEE
jgi:hypothetical protein